jgi:hypothetical protein
MGINPYSRYPTKTNAPDADYPYGSARNITTPGDGTGTPWEQAVVNDLWGWMQNLLYQAGISPSGNPDKKGTSQYYDAIRRTAGYPGMVSAFMTNVDPATLGIRVILLEGGSVQVALYHNLYEACYCGDANNPTAEAFYTSTDPEGVNRSITGGWLQLPNTRGRFLRGYDPSGIVDPDGETRLPGDTQAWCQADHAHAMSDLTNSYLSSSRQQFASPGAGSDLWLYRQTWGADPVRAGCMLDPTPGSDILAGPELKSTEVRPMNNMVFWAIWY